MPTLTKFMYTGDRHLKAGRNQLPPYAAAQKTLVAKAKDEGVTAVFDAGDSRVDCASSEYAKDVEMQTLILPLARAGIGYYSIDGNHDRPGATEKEITANSWLAALKDQDLWAMAEYWNDSKLRTLSLGNVGVGSRVTPTNPVLQIIPLPYPPRHMFAAGKDLKTKKDLDAAASLYIQDQLTAALKDVNPEMPLLILFHGTVDSPRLKLAGEARMPAGHDVNLPINAFPKRPNVAVACGHIHMHQILSEDSPLVFYTGPLVPQEFDHEDLDCGAVILTLKDGKTWELEFVPIASICYKTVTVTFDRDVKDALGNIVNELFIKDRVLKEITQSERTVVKVKIVAAPGQEFDRGAIREALEAAGIIDPRIVIELPEQPLALDTEQKIHDEIGSNVQANLAAYLKEQPAQAAALEAAGATVQDAIDATTAIEREAFQGEVVS